MAFLAQIYAAAGQPPTIRNTRSFSVPSISSSGRPLGPGGRRQSTLQSLGLRKKNDVEIVLDGAEDFVHSYSTFDEIKGNVILKFEKDTAIDDISITFEGVSLTYVEKVATTAPTTGRTTGRHHFLKLLQPVGAEDLPENRIAKAGTTYSIPFTFVVPDRLLPQICSHTTQSGEVTRAHLQLPPSLGDAAVAGDGQKLYDDLAPDMSKVLYSIRVRMAKRNPVGQHVELTSKSLKIRIVPGKDEEPPIHVETGEADYAMRKEKSVRKGLFKLGKVGRIVAETSQPPSLRVPHPTKRSETPVTTMTTISLRFDPGEVDTQPPPLSSCTTKLRSYTFFGAAPYKTLPEASAQDNWSSLHGLYPDTVELSSRNLSTVTWTKHESDGANSDLMRRPSTFSDLSVRSIPEATETYSKGPFWTASVLVPISLPTNSRKTFVPSFHSCIISRSYTLELNISYSSPGTSVGSSSIVLKSPIQISSEGGKPPEGVEETEAALAAEIERQFYEFESSQLRDAEAAVLGNGEPTPPLSATTTNVQSPSSLQRSVIPEEGVLPQTSELPPSPEYTEAPAYDSVVPRAAYHAPLQPTPYTAPPPAANFTPTYAAVPPPEYHSGAGGRVRGGVAPRVRTQSVSSLHVDPSPRVRTSVQLRIGGLFLF